MSFIVFHAKILLFLLLLGCEFEDATADEREKLPPGVSSLNPLVLDLSKSTINEDIHVKLNTSGKPYVNITAIKPTCLKEGQQPQRGNFSFGVGDECWYSIKWYFDAIGSGAAMMIPYVHKNSDEKGVKVAKTFEFTDSEEEISLNFSDRNFSATRGQPIGLESLCPLKMNMSRSNATSVDFVIRKQLVKSSDCPMLLKFSNYQIWNETNSNDPNAARFLLRAIVIATIVVLAVLVAAVTAVCVYFCGQGKADAETTTLAAEPKNDKSEKVKGKGCGREKNSSKKTNRKPNPIKGGKGSAQPPTSVVDNDKQAAVQSSQPLMRSQGPAKQSDVDGSGKERGRKESEKTQPNDEKTGGVDWSIGETLMAKSPHAMK